MLEAIFAQLVTKAARGDHRAMQLLLLYQLPDMEKHIFGSRKTGGLSSAAEERIRKALLGEDFENETPSKAHKEKLDHSAKRTRPEERIRSAVWEKL